MTEIKGYHAHVYYDAATRPAAERLRDAIVGKFAVEPGAFSDEPRGPHPISQCAVIFRTEEFQNIVPWLMLNRDGLDVLVHPLTESSYDDHSKNALWLGTPVPMRPDILRPTNRTTIELFPVANLFCPGHRLRLDISSSNFPHFDVNPNSGEPERAWRQPRTARDRVFAEAARPSHVLLPIIPPGE
jgi:aromatic ring-cleaving dioxygenase